MSLRGLLPLFIGSGLAYYGFKKQDQEGKKLEKEEEFEYLEFEDEDLAAPNGDGLKQGKESSE